MKVSMKYVLTYIILVNNLKTPLKFLHNAISRSSITTVDLVETGKEYLEDGIPHMEMIVTGAVKLLK
jgi:predicted GNAT family N-acyltransferase